jgi:transcriptional regulator with XRE-family HTH domain
MPRLEAGLTLNQVAHQSGVDVQMVNQYERMRAYPVEDKAQRVADVLGKEVDYLFPDEYRDIVSFVRNQEEIALLSLRRLCPGFRMTQKLPKVGSSLAFGTLRG